MALAYAAAVNAEALDLKTAGVDAIQLDEPWLQARPAAARYGLRAINRALEGVPGQTYRARYASAMPRRAREAEWIFLPAQFADCVADAISIEAAQPKLDLGVLRELSGKAILLGVIDLGSPEVESPRQVAARIRAGLDFVDAERLTPAPDCGMKYLTRAQALAS